MWHHRAHRLGPRLEREHPLHDQRDPPVTRKPRLLLCRLLRQPLAGPRRRAACLGRVLPRGRVARRDRAASTRGADRQSGGILGRGAGSLAIGWAGSWSRTTGSPASLPEPAGTQPYSPLARAPFGNLLIIVVVCAVVEPVAAPLLSGLRGDRRG